MPTFSYSARSSNGQLSQGKEEAATEALAVAALQSRGFLVTKISLFSGAGQEARGRKKKRHRKIKSGDLIFFLNNLVMLLEAGVTLLRSLEIIADLTESQKLNEVLGTIIANIRSGSTLKDSMARHPAHFPAFWAYLVEAGEASGSLPLVLKELAKNLEASDRLTKKMISAMIYPAILVIASIGVVLVFMLKIIPIFQKIFSQFHSKLPPLTQNIINFSSFLQHYFVIMAIGIGVFIYLLRSYIATPIGRRSKDQALLGMPILGDAISDFVHARICVVLSTLIKSGLNLLRSMEIASRAAGNSLFENSLNIVGQKVQQGKTLGNAMREDPLFSPMMVQLIMIGEESGELPKMIAKAAQYYEEKVDIISTRLGVLIEPIILIFVGAVIGVIALGLFLPMFTLSNAVH